MTATLASNFSDNGAVAGLFLGTLLFLVSLGAAFVVAKRRPGVEMALVVVWALVYPFAQLAILFYCAESLPMAPFLSFVFPAAVSAGLLGWVTRSWFPVAGCALGTVATVVVGEGLGLSPWVAVPWNICCGAGLMVWGVRARLKIVPKGHCASCGYDLRGTARGVCPECGIANAEGR